MSCKGRREVSHLACVSGGEGGRQSLLVFAFGFGTFVCFISLLVLIFSFSAQLMQKIVSVKGVATDLVDI